MLRHLGLVAKRYTAVMDNQTCRACGSLHGTVLAIDDRSITVPNPSCTCLHGCDCIWMYLTAEDAAALAPERGDVREGI